MRRRRAPLARGNAPEDYGSGLLNCFQALAQEIGVSAPKLDVVQSIFSPPPWLSSFITYAHLHHATALG
jgi:hypothetical protein